MTASTHVRRSKLLAALGIIAVVAAFAPPRTAGAAPDIGAIILATGGQVTVTLEERHASDESHLFVIDPADDTTRHFVGSNFDPPGTMVDVSALLGGNPPKGEELIFEIQNLRSDCLFQTGPGERNPDGEPHADVEELGVMNNHSTILVGFEDLAKRDGEGNMPAGCPNEQIGDSDFDFNDNVFRMTGLIVNPLPALVDANPSIIHVTEFGIYFPNVSAYLYDGAGVPIQNREIVFTQTDFLLGGGAELCRASTDSTGLASCGDLFIEIDAVLGVGFEAIFEGDGLYLPASDHGPLVTVVPGLDVL